MPKNSPAESSSPPSVMTWRKATPLLLVAAVFDALRFMCEWLIFFGLAVAAAVCSYFVSSDNAIATMVGTASCSLLAAGGGILAAPVLETFGIVMGMAVGLLGWLIIAVALLRGNARIFRANFLWMLLALLGSEIPLVGSVPFITLVLWRMYSREITQDKAALARYQQAHAEEEKRRRMLIAEQTAAAANEEAAAEEIPEPLPAAA